MEFSLNVPDANAGCAHILCLAAIAPSIVPIYEDVALVRKAARLATNTRKENGQQCKGKDSSIYVVYDTLTVGNNYDQNEETKPKMQEVRAKASSLFLLHRCSEEIHSFLKK